MSNKPQRNKYLMQNSFPPRGKPNIGRLAEAKFVKIGGSATRPTNIKVPY
jgi:hypothetical protein